MYDRWIREIEGAKIEGSVSAGAEPGRGSRSSGADRAGGELVKARIDEDGASQSCRLSVLGYSSVG